MNTYVVAATRLNLRSSPSIEPGNVLTTLAHGDELRGDVVGSSRNWLQVEATLGAHTLRGFTVARFVHEKSEARASAQHTKIEPVHLGFSASARRDSTRGRSFPLSESIPRRSPEASMSEKVAALHRIIEALDVEHSARYAATSEQTYCNIYAYDFTYAAAVYLPRVWLREKALVDLASGKEVPVLYGKTVRELSANSLFDWLEDWGDDFGWQRSFDLAELQAQVNQGAVGVICAKRAVPQRSGHITCVLPEVIGRSALRSGSSLIAPLQSQAGSKNKRYFATSWWIERRRDFAASGFWWHA